MQKKLSFVNTLWACTISRFVKPDSLESYQYVKTTKASSLLG